MVYTTVFGKERPSDFNWLTREANTAVLDSSVWWSFPVWVGRWSTVYFDIWSICTAINYEWFQHADTSIQIISLLTGSVAVAVRATMLASGKTAHSWLISPYIGRKSVLHCTAQCASAMIVFDLFVPLECRNQFHCFLLQSLLDAQPGSETCLPLGPQLSLESLPLVRIIQRYWWCPAISWVWNKRWGIHVYLQMLLLP